MNLLSPLPAAEAAERVDSLLTRPSLRIERIVSQGQASPPGFWYDQPEGEWVLLLAGAARFAFRRREGGTPPRARRLGRDRAASPS